MCVRYISMSLCCEECVNVCILVNDIEHAHMQYLLLDV